MKKMAQKLKDLTITAQVSDCYVGLIILFLFKCFFEMEFRDTTVSFCISFPLVFLSAVEQKMGAVLYCVCLCGCGRTYLSIFEVGVV